MYLFIYNGMFHQSKNISKLLSNNKNLKMTKYFQQAMKFECR